MSSTVRPADPQSPLEAGAASRKSALPSPRPLRQLVPRARPHMGKLGIAFVCLVGSAGIGLAFPLIVRDLLDAAFLRSDASSLDRIALMLVALFGAQALLNFAQVYLLGSTAERVVARIRDDLYAHLVRLSPAFFTERRTGELTSRLAADTAVLQAVLSHYSSEFARQILYLTGGIVLLTLTHPDLTLTTLAVVPIVVGAAYVFGRALRRASTGVQDRVADAMGTAEEAFAQIRTVQSFAREDEEARRFSSLLSGVVRAAVRRAWLRGLFFGAITFAAFGGVVAVLWQGGRLVLAGVLTPGSLVSFLLYAITVAAAVGALASLFGSYSEAVGAARRVFELLEERPTVAEPKDPLHLARPVRGRVRLENVTFRYRPELPPVLENFSAELGSGEVVALVGPSGAGKTTVVNLLLRFWDVSAGRITIDGVDIHRLPLAELRTAVGLVPQETALFSGTVGENIAYARSDASEDEIHAAAHAAHAHEFIQLLPSGYETRVGERGVKLSGGQRQRIAIARVFLENPAVVVLDEATSNLDSESERLVEEAMQDLLRGRTTLIIAHRLSTVQRADRVIVLERGRIVEEGSHAELLAAEGLYARLYRGQFRAERPGELAEMELGYRSRDVFPRGASGS